MGEFIITESIYMELTNPPIFTGDYKKQIFGKAPNTRNSNKVAKEQFEQHAKFVDIDFIAG